MLKSLILFLGISLPVSCQQTDLLSNNKVIWWDGAKALYSINESGQPVRMPIALIDVDGPGRPRPKFRNGYVWQSNGKTIIGTHLDTKQRIRVVAPEGVRRFNEFDVFGENQIAYWGIEWKSDGHGLGEKGKYKIAILYDYLENKISKILYELPARVGEEFIAGVKATEVYSVAIQDYIVFIEKFSGVAHIFNKNSSNSDIVECVNKKDLPEGMDAINNGPSIPWATPLGEDELLLMARVWIPANPTSNLPGIWNNTFKILNLRSRLVIEKGIEYRGFSPASANILTVFKEQLVKIEQVWDQVVEVPGSGGKK